MSEKIIITVFMQVTLSPQSADARWSGKALLSANVEKITLHLTSNDKQIIIQRVGHKIDVQKIRKMKLVGEG